MKGSLPGPQDIEFLAMTPEQIPLDVPPPLPTASAPPATTSSAPPVQIHIDKLSKSYGGKTALLSLDLSIHQGDIFGFIGPNGAGKTTTLRILAALLLPTNGTASIAGVDVVQDPRRIKEMVGYMPDSFGVYENMTLHEYLDFFGAAYKIPRPRRQAVIRDVLELTDLGSKSNDQVSAFSRGMKQRACLAKTLLHDPSVLILDEPASGLDPRARIEFRELLRELQRMGKTIIVSSHILTELSTLCNTVGIIEAGNLVAAGSVQDILQGLRATRKFTVDLLNAADVARIVAWLERRDGIQSVQSDGSTVRFSFEAADEEIATLAELLIAEKARFTSFREELVDLETAFMTLTRGKLA